MGKKQRQNNPGQKAPNALPTCVIETTEKRAYVKLPVEEVKGSNRLCIFNGPTKTWQVDAESLTKRLDNKRKAPIDFCDEGPCWTFYFDEEEGTLYNDFNDEEPYMGLLLSKRRVTKQKESKTIQTEQGNQKKKELTLPNPTLPSIPQQNNSTIVEKKNESANSTPKVEQADKEATSPQQNTHPAALNQSGKGHEEKREFEAALRDYQKSFESGYSPAGYNLGKLLIKLAADIFTQTAKQGHKGALMERNRLISFILGKDYNELAEKPTDAQNHSSLKDAAIYKTVGSKQSENTATNVDETSKSAREIKHESVKTKAENDANKKSSHSYEQMANQVSSLNSIEQYRLAKLSLTYAAKNRHVGAAKQLKKWDVDLSLPPISPRTGCFFCRLLDKLSTLFSRK